ncbi:MAG TPA: transglycosylase SLT domain-containing protein [Solirubrobacteraceae bacterium]|nr:transglycosylase SLT domain-containing protein [Solirubrobacteraceae bacterium]
MRVRAFLLAVLVSALFPVAASANYAHEVQRGETLTSVAAVDGLSIEAIARANGISPQAQLIAGQTLWIPPRDAANAALGTATSSSTTNEQVAATSSHTSTTTTTTQDDAADPDDDGDTDTAADTTAATSSTTQASTQSSSQTTTTASQSSSSTPGPVPTLERVSSAEIAGVADANGVPAALAEAIAWEESGWNNDEVSSVGAVGVMQIVPATWSWIDRYLTPTNPLGTASAAENIRAGTLLLRQLLSLTGGNEQLAVAGYYQGLASVRRFGMYPSTQHYVANVMALAQRF